MSTPLCAEDVLYLGKDSLWYKFLLCSKDSGILNIAQCLALKKAVIRLSQTSSSASGFTAQHQTYPHAAPVQPYPSSYPSRPPPQTYPPSSHPSFSAPMPSPPTLAPYPTSPEQLQAHPQPYPGDQTGYPGYAASPVSTAGWTGGRAGEVTSHTHTRMHARTHTHAGTRAHTHSRTHARTHTFTHARANTHTCTRMDAYTHARTHTYIYMHYLAQKARTSRHIHIMHLHKKHARTNTHTHTYTHIICYTKHCL